MKQAFLSQFLSSLLVSIFLTLPVQAVIGTWNNNPTNSDWNLGSNWSSHTAPNGAGDIASFGLSSTTSLFLSTNTEVDTVVFNPVASGYTITARPNANLTMNGRGVINDSTITQTLIAGVDASGGASVITFAHNAMIGSATTIFSSGSLVRSLYGGVIAFRDSASAGLGTLLGLGSPVAVGRGGLINFYDSAEAGRAVLSVNAAAIRGGHQAELHFYNNSTAAQAAIVTYGGTFGNPGDFGGTVYFHDQATAAQARLTCNSGSVAGSSGGAIGFFDGSTAGSAVITHKGGQVDGALGGVIAFSGNASAGNSLIVNEGASGFSATGAFTVFSGSSTADSATIIVNGGSGPGISGGGVEFDENSSGSLAQVRLFGNGLLGLRQHNGALTIGSLEGTGRVYLGGNTLMVGANNRSTEFSGAMHDGDQYGADPSGGSLRKIGTGTMVLSGQSDNTGVTMVSAGKLVIDGSVLTPVLVNSGTLGGRGSMGAMSVADSAILSPGNGVGILHVNGNLTLSLDATYLVDLDGTVVGTEYDQTAVAGSISLWNPTLSLSLAFQAQPGMIFTIIENDGSDPINGIFARLSEGAIFTVDSSTFNITYQGGDGNDVVLTAVVPEPGTWLLFSLGTLLLAASMRTRR